ncbi:HAD-IA family hydrolase [Pontivivens insulae]|uniref:Phosphorylated carbohydrates phosphatase n=1 Tax=Pontivivens insulae TaxID=1639689 RepID=A0A2R8ADD6_9RHOB|nr:HAD-IA family hydrolase [Pontivivens insulae]RED14188.1 HAD superfamily hydrolase (TIGR01509 family) [Pontivivens insulae]SPF30263.1 Phosphorylated carbohydrates phosphatase [Pontivivens insulae]
MDGILFGSVGVIAETSHLQRAAFNEAFAKAGLDWRWEEEEYNRMLKQSGGANRIRSYADARRDKLTEDQVTELHLSKTKLFDETMVEEGLRPRPGIQRLLREARAAGLATAFVTTTSQANIDAMLAALGETIEADMFDLITTAGMVDNGKPAPDIYTLAIERLNLTQAVAIEDSAPSMEAAVAAGLTCLVTPGAAHADDDFAKAAAVVAHLGDPENHVEGADLPDGFVTLDWLRSLA